MENVYKDDICEEGAIGEEDGASGTDRANLIYEIESAKRQIASLRAMLAVRTKEVARLQDQLIDREVLLKQAASCIREAAELCREQMERLDGARRACQDYEGAWRVLHARLEGMREQMPAVPVASVAASGAGDRLAEARDAVDGSVRRAQESLRQIFGEEGSSGPMSV